MPSFDSNRRRALCGAGALMGSALAGLPSGAAAQTLPDLIRIIMPLATGSSLDARARVIAEAMSRRLSQRVIVENRPGAGQTLGALFVAKAKPDGGTLLFNNNGHIISPHIYKDLQYDVLKDLAPVTQVYETGMVLVVHPSVKAASLKELVAAARASSLNYASSGTGGMPHLCMELFTRTAGITLGHVPYKGDSQAMIDVLAGQVPMMISGYPAAIPHIKAGKLRALAVTSAKRAAIFPDVPTIAEAGYPNAVVSVWAGIFAPARTPPAVVDRLNREIAAAMAMPIVTEHLSVTGAQALVNSPKDFGTFVAKESERFSKIVKELGLKME